MGFKSDLNDQLVSFSAWSLLVYRPDDETDMSKN